MRKSYEDTKFVIGIPYGHDHVPVHFVESLLKLEKPPNCEILFLGRTITSAARNLIVDKALMSGADYLFFLDSDMFIPPDTIRKLWEHDKQIVSGLYCRRGGGNYFAFLFNKEYKCFYNAPYINFAKELIEVDGAATGCLLIKCEVFNLFDPPWFFYDDGSEINTKARKELIESSESIFGTTAPVSRLSVFQDGYGRGEDLNFFKLCYEKGIKCYIDPSVFCGHVGTCIYGDPGLKLVRPPKKEDETSQ